MKFTQTSFYRFGTLLPHQVTPPVTYLRDEGLLLLNSEQEQEYQQLELRIRAGL